MTALSPRVRATLGAVSLLVLGLVLGIVADRVVLSHRPESPTVIGPEDHSAALADLARHLELTEAQTADVHQVFRRFQSSVDGAWSDMRDRLVAVVDSATSELETVLDSAQVVRLHQWIAERHADMAARHGASARPATRHMLPGIHQ